MTVTAREIPWEGKLAFCPEKTEDMTNEYNLGCYIGARNRRGALVGKLVKSR